MAYDRNHNKEVIKKLRECFVADDRESDSFNSFFPFTNCALMFAYNGTGKTRLSYDFAHYGREDDTITKHTLYYNAYTEDLFTWKNDHENNEENILLINQDTAFIQGLAGMAIEVGLRNYLQMFTDIDFEFDYTDNNPALPPCSVRFSKKRTYTIELNGEEQTMEEISENIKISRGEERLFVWCFFRRVMDEVLNGNPAYQDIEYIYIDDPISSLDDNNVIVFAQQLYEAIRKQRSQEIAEYVKRDCRRIKFVISSHHALFFHVMAHGLEGDKRLQKFYLHRDKQTNEVVLKEMSEKNPFYYNVAMMAEVQKAIKNDKLYTYHFTIMRSVMEKIEEFFGHRDHRFVLDGIKYRDNIFEESAFSKGELTDLYSRIVNVFSHQGSFFVPVEMNEDNKIMLKSLFYHIKKKYNFILPDLTDERSEKDIAKAKRETTK